MRIAKSRGASEQALFLLQAFSLHTYTSQQNFFRTKSINAKHQTQTPLYLRYMVDLRSLPERPSGHLHNQILSDVCRESLGVSGMIVRPIHGSRIPHGMSAITHKAAEIMPTGTHASSNFSSFSSLFFFGFCMPLSTLPP